MPNSNRNPQPLVDNQPITNQGGFPTQYFIRWAQERLDAIQGSVTPDQVAELIAEFLTEHPLIEGAGISLTPSGDIGDDVTVALTDTGVTPDTYGDATHSAQLTIDAQGRVTNAVDVAIAGGGGGGGSIWGFSGLAAANPFAPTAVATGAFANLPQTSMGTAPVLSFYWNGGTTNTLTFDFLTPVTIAGIGLLSDRASTSQGFFQVSGSNDNITYTNLDVPQDWTGAANRIISFANTTAYRWYKMTQVSGTGNNGQYQTQFLFYWTL